MAGRTWQPNLNHEKQATVTMLKVEREGKTAPLHTNTLFRATPIDKLYSPKHQESDANTYNKTTDNN